MAEGLAPSASGSEPHTELCAAAAPAVCCLASKLLPYAAMYCAAACGVCPIPRPRHDVVKCAGHVSEGIVI